MTHSLNNTGITDKPEFIIFVSGMYAMSDKANENLRKIEHEHLNREYDVQINDNSRDKEHADQFQIICINTLIKTSRAAPVTMLWDVSGRQKVARN